jgi:hypothetical protein
MDKFRLVGYWNGSKTNPKISFDIPIKKDDNRKLVVIDLTEIPDNPDNPDNSIKSKSISKATKELESSLNKALTILKSYK